jgi:hypothetical protein
VALVLLAITLIVNIVDSGHSDNTGRPGCLLLDLPALQQKNALQADALTSAGRWERGAATSGL